MHVPNIQSPVIEKQIYHVKTTVARSHDSAVQVLLTQLTISSSESWHAPTDIPVTSCLAGAAILTRS